MSYEPSKQFKNFLEQLSERGASRVCPVCGREEWVGMGGGAPDAIALLSQTAGAGEPNAYPVFGLYCDNCGFIRLHHTREFQT